MNNPAERALVVGASGGIGSAFVRKLQADGVTVSALSRTADGLNVTREDSVAAALNALDGPFDLVVVATGALEIDGHRPEKSLRQLSPDAMRLQFETNCIGPAMVLKHALRLVPRQTRSVLAVLSARVGSIGDNRLGGWYSYRAAKAAVNQVVHSASIEIARTHRQAICVALHPGTVATPFTEKYADGYDRVAPDDAAANLMRVIDGLSVQDTGQFFDWKGERVPW